MPPMCARHVTAKVASMGGETDPAHFVNLPWRPISTTISIPREPPKPANAPPEEEQRQKRDKLAASAQSRYEEWKTNQPPPGRPETSASIISHHFPKFREREKARELHGDWASADKVPNERERIRTAVANAEATYLQSPPYPKQGGSVKNVEFSYMSSGYDYRQRLPSKEVAGTWSIMRTRALTESARINESIAAQRMSDIAGGGRWTIDQRYGNPGGNFTPTTTGDAFRQASPHKWMGSPTRGPAQQGAQPATARALGGSPSSPFARSPSLGRSPPQTAPGMRMRKWRGGFVTDFPPRTAAAEPLSGAAPPWMHHRAPYEDKFHETVAVHIPESIRHGSPMYRPARDRSKELTSGVTGPHPQFWPGPLATGGEVLPNPSASCTWNTAVPPSPIPDKAYLKTGRSPTRALDGDALLSASQVQSGVTSGSG